MPKDEHSQPSTSKESPKKEVEEYKKKISKYRREHNTLQEELEENKSTFNANKVSEERNKKIISMIEAYFRAKKSVDNLSSEKNNDLLIKKQEEEMIKQGVISNLPEYFESIEKGIKKSDAICFFADNELYSKNQEQESLVKKNEKTKSKIDIIKNKIEEIKKQEEKIKLLLAEKEKFEWQKNWQEVFPASNDYKNKNIFDSNGKQIFIDNSNEVIIKVYDWDKQQKKENDEEILKELKKIQEQEIEEIQKIPAIIKKRLESDRQDNQEEITYPNVVNKYKIPVNKIEENVKNAKYQLLNSIKNEDNFSTYGPPNKDEINKWTETRQNKLKEIEQKIDNLIVSDVEQETIKVRDQQKQELTKSFTEYYQNQETKLSIKSDENKLKDLEKQEKVLKRKKDNYKIEKWFPTQTTKKKRENEWKECKSDIEQLKEKIATSKQTIKNEEKIKFILEKDKKEKLRSFSNENIDKEIKNTEHLLDTTKQELQKLKKILEKKDIPKPSTDENLETRLKELKKDSASDIKRGIPKFPEESGNFLKLLLINDTMEELNRLIEGYKQQQEEIKAEQAKNEELRNQNKKETEKEEKSLSEKTEQALKEEKEKTKNKKATNTFKGRLSL